MILVFDVGNTETTVGLFDGVVLRRHWRLTTVPERTPDELAIVIVQLLRFANADQLFERALQRLAESQTMQQPPLF